jgi:hypothetical protein
MHELLPAGGGVEPMSGANGRDLSASANDMHRRRRHVAVNATCLPSSAIGSTGRDNESVDRVSQKKKRPEIIHEKGANNAWWCLGHMLAYLLAE